MSGPLYTPAFLDFVLSHTRVKNNIGSRQKTRQPYRLELRTIPDYNYIWVHQGRAVWVIEDTPYELSPGLLLLVPPDTPHHGYSTTRRVIIGSIHVEPTLPGGQQVFELLVPARIRHVKKSSPLTGYLQGAIAEWDRADRAQIHLMMPSWATLVTLELLRYDASQGLLRQRATDPLIGDVLEELNRRIAQPTDLDELAAWSGFSPQHLNRTFRRILGVTPLQYLAKMRMEHAATLLADDRLTVRAIAIQCGFDDPYYFSRLFKQHFGRSPAQYRHAAGSENPS